MQSNDDVVPGGPRRSVPEAPAAQPPDAAPDLSALRPLDPRVVKAWRAAWLIRAALAASAALVVVWLSHTSPFAAGGIGAVALLCLAVAAFLPPARYRAWGFQLRPADLLVRHGVLWRTVSVVPHARIQYVDTRRGPLERALGLTTVAVYTAGSRGAAVRIPGLAAEDARLLRDRLAALGGTDDAV